MQRGKARSDRIERPANAEGGPLSAASSAAPVLVPSRRGLLTLAVAAFVAQVLPLCLGSGAGAAFARGGDDSSGSGGSGSGGSDDDDDDDDDDDHSGHGGGGGSGSGGSGSGSGNGGSGSGGSGSGNGGGSGSGGRRDQELLWVKFRDGHTEQINSGTFQRTNGAGAIVEQRRALRSDVNRLSVYRAVSAASIQEVEGLILFSTSQNAAQVIDRSGWAEMVNGGVYQLTDPNGNLVTRRAATGDDMLRISVMAGQN